MLVDSKMKPLESGTVLMNKFTIASSGMTLSDIFIKFNENSPKALKVWNQITLEDKWDDTTFEAQPVGLHIHKVFSINKDNIYIARILAFFQKVGTQDGIISFAFDSNGLFKTERTIYWYAIHTALKRIKYGTREDFEVIQDRICAIALAGEYAEYPANPFNSKELRLRAIKARNLDSYFKPLKTSEYIEQNFKSAEKRGKKENDALYNSIVCNKFFYADSPKPSSKVGAFKLFKQQANLLKKASVKKKTNKEALMEGVNQIHVDLKELNQSNFSRQKFFEEILSYYSKGQLLEAHITHIKQIFFEKLKYNLELSNCTLVFLASNAPIESKLACLENIIGVLTRYNTYVLSLLRHLMPNSQTPLQKASSKN